MNALRILSTLARFLHEGWPPKLRLALEITFVVLITAVSSIAAFALRLDFDFHEFPLTWSLFLTFVVLVAARVVAYGYFRVYRSAWRYTSINEAVAICKAHVSSSLIFAVGILLIRSGKFPRSVVFIELLVSLVLGAAVRVAVRLAFERLSKELSHSEGSRAVVVFGGGDSGHLLVKNLLTNPAFPYRPIAVFDDSERLHGTLVHGVPVAGALKDADSYLSEHSEVTLALVAIPGLSSARWDYIRKLCSKRMLVVKRMQAFEDIAVQEAYRAGPDISVETVLEKAVQAEYRPEVATSLTGKRILITGAGGSIGSELVRQLIDLKPAKLLLMDNSEYNLFRLDLEIREKQLGVPHEPIVADVRNAQRVDGIWVEHLPEICFHAAAYKHVPMMERHAYEAFSTNVIGTVNVLSACQRCGTDRFVFISTDKAVEPRNVMGYSKRMAELVVKSLTASNRKGGKSGTKAAIVRFGNVINSSGSVIPIFREQILSGGPLTVTHPEAERYFMSTQEAVKLILAAGLLGQDGEIFVLNMGEKIRIFDLAQKMLALYGRRDIPIVFTGLREGEALTEELIGRNESIRETPIDEVKEVVETFASPEQWLMNLRKFDAAILGSGPDSLIERMKELSRTI